MTKQIDKNRKQRNHVNNMRNATKTNSKINNSAKLMRYLGNTFKYIAIASEGYDLITSPMEITYKSLLKSGAALSGGYYGGRVGAKWGARFGVYGVVAGSVVGGAIGGYFGQEAVDWALE